MGVAVGVEVAAGVGVVVEEGTRVKVGEGACVAVGKRVGGIGSLRPLDLCGVIAAIAAVGVYVEGARDEFVPASVGCP